MTVRIEEAGEVWTIVHDRPEARGAMDPPSAEALFEAVLAFEASGARVAVLTGAGGHFCSGWDLKYAASLTGAAEREAVFSDLALPLGSAPAPRGAIGPTRVEATKPVIAAVEGAAVAGGMELALWADCRVMGQGAYMGVYCRRWGIPLVDGGAVRLPRLVGQGRALEIAMTGRKVPAEECLAIGLCERVVPDGEARGAAEQMAREIARFPAAAMLADRRTIIESRGMSVRDGLRLEWANGMEALRRDAVSGAQRFAGGKGRHGDFGEI